MHEFVQVLALLLGFYAAFGLMCIGFGYLFAGQRGGARAAQFYFARSLRWTGWQVRQLCSRVLTLAWGALMFRIVRPLGYRLWRGLRWLLMRERGWLRRW